MHGRDLEDYDSTSVELGRILQSFTIILGCRQIIRYPSALAARKSLLRVEWYKPISQATLQTRFYLFTITSV
jgi:hypothetical protein